MSRKRNKKGRDVHGVLLLNKPLGLTSNAALQRVKRIYQAKKAGHTGNLDPLATGMLPICLGEATKVSAFLLDADKHYATTCKLGVTTSTGDTEGDIVERRPVPALKKNKLDKLLDRFRGEIQQIPPMYSAIKHQGTPLYKLARQGVKVERSARTVNIHALEIESVQGDLLALRIECSKGTYIRTLVEDIGGALGCGAHVLQLHRTLTAPFTTEPMHTLDEIGRISEAGPEALNDLLLPVDAALQDWPETSVGPDMALYLRQGQPVLVPQTPVEGLLRLYAKHTDGQQFIGIGQVMDDGRIGPKRLIFS